MGGAPAPCAAKSALAGEILAKVPGDAFREYVEATVAVNAPGCSVEPSLDVGGGKGRGLLAARACAEGEVALVDRPLASLQHTSNRSKALVCSHCCSFLGTTELQIARQLLGDRLVTVWSLARFCEVDGGARDAEPAGAEPTRSGKRKRAASDDARPADAADPPDAAEPHPAEASEAARDLKELLDALGPYRMFVPFDADDGRRARTSANGDRDTECTGCSEGGCTDCEDDGTDASLTIPVGLLLGMFFGGVRLPGDRAGDAKLHQVHVCPGGCREAFCSVACARAAWEEGHRLTCPGTDPDDPAVLQLYRPDGQVCGPAPGAPSEPRGAGGAALPSWRTCRPPWIAASSTELRALFREAPPPRGIARPALQEFVQHADDTNDVFLLAAGVVAHTLLRASRLLSRNGTAHTPELMLAAVAEAWRPFAMGQRAIWWEQVARPSDVAPAEEAGFRRSLKTLALDSLALLHAALADVELPGVPRALVHVMLSEDVWGGVIGMFELNNLDIDLPSPVTEYFERDGGAQPALKGPWGEVDVAALARALGWRCSVACSGTGFFPLQSLLNHSCDPALLVAMDYDGGSSSVTLLARRDIRAGEELTISYVDTALPTDERGELLRDYGFTCTCPRCMADDPLRGGAS
ncbi:unnamed protein product [Pedinophyceae sp. YPF-701]|nr:unnamed protein product [Pedinophyceae sp. YPF-701]